MSSSDLGFSTVTAFAHTHVRARTQTDGDLMKEELTEIWDAAPKFPEVDVSDERIDVDSFVQGM